jgi:flagellin
MASFINTNIASMNAQRNLSSSANGLTTALQRLSSGLRINSAKDDAAGMAISSRMSSQINGLTQAARNANDAISLSQTAEGALSGISDNLQRLRTLAVQSANSTNSDSDRATIQTEVASLVDEIGRVANTTEFNGIKLLDGSFSKQAFQVGANANQTISVSVSGATTDKLGGSQAASLTATNNGVAMASGDISINGVAIGGSTSSSDHSSSLGKAASAISKAAAINAMSAQTGVTATADANEVGGASMTAAATTGALKINGVSTASIDTTLDAAASRAAVIKAINAISGQTGVVASDGGSSAGGVKLTAADGRNIVASIGGTLTSASTGLAGLAASNVSYGKYTLTSSKAISVTGNATNLNNAGVKAGSYASQTAFVSTVAAATVGTANAAAFAASDFKINGIAIGASAGSSDGTSYALAANVADLAKSAISKVAAINAISGQTGVTATANANTVAGSSMTAAALTGTLKINGIDTASITTSATDNADSRTAVMNAINAISGQTGVTAVDGGTSAAGISLVAADGRNITVSATTLTSAATGIANAAAGDTTFGTFTLSSAKSFTVSAGTTGATATTTGMVEQGTYGAGRSGQALSTIDVSTASGANDAITAIDNAIASVNSSRSDLGAIQNRFASTVSTLQSTSENLSAAKSRITDTDFAAETATLTRGQILQQAGTAMLAQANSLPNGVLALLRG